MICIAQVGQHKVQDPLDAHHLGRYYISVHLYSLATFAFKGLDAVIVSLDELKSFLPSIISIEGTKK